MAGNPENLKDFDGDGKIGGSVPAKPKFGKLIEVKLPGEKGDTFPAVVTDVAEDGSINAQCYRADGPGVFYTGLKSAAERDALPDADPGRNLPFWQWPPKNQQPPPVLGVDSGQRHRSPKPE